MRAGGDQEFAKPLLAEGHETASASAMAPRRFVSTAMTVGLYLALNSSLNLLNRYTLGHAGFRYPLSLTCFHLAFQMCSLGPLLMRPPYAGTHGEVLGRNWRAVAMIGAFMSLNIGLNNASLLHLSLSFNQVIRASIPVVCAVCAVFVEKKVPTPSEALGLVLVATGVMATVTGSRNGPDSAPNEFIGLVFCLVATLSNALMMTFSGKIMVGTRRRRRRDVTRLPRAFLVLALAHPLLDTRRLRMPCFSRVVTSLALRRYVLGGEKLDALRLTFYTSPVTLGLIFPVSVGMEWERMIERLGLPPPPGQEDTFYTGRGLLTLVLLGCCNAVVYNWVHNKVIAITSATTTTVLGNVKVACLVLFSRVLFGETKDWSWEMVGGAVMALGGFAIYSAAKVKAMRRAAALQHAGK